MGSTGCSLKSNKGLFISDASHASVSRERMLLGPASGLPEALKSLHCPLVSSHHAQKHLIHLHSILLVFCFILFLQLCWNLPTLLGQDLLFV